jgi:hypothetical protein
LTTTKHVIRVQKVDGWSRPDGICNLTFSTSAGSSATRHHNSKWSLCNCALTILNWTPCSSRACKNITLPSKQTCIPGVTKYSTQGHIFLKIKLLFIYLVRISRSSKQNGASHQPGHCLTIGKHHPSRHEVLTWFGW